MGLRSCEQIGDGSTLGQEPRTYQSQAVCCFRYSVFTKKKRNGSDSCRLPWPWCVPSTCSLSMTCLLPHSPPSLLERNLWINFPPKITDPYEFLQPSLWFSTYLSQRDLDGSTSHLLLDHPHPVSVSFWSKSI